MNCKVAVILTNYNMPERTNAIVEHIIFTVNHPIDYYIVDNGSDLVEPSKYTTVKLDRNRQTTGGFLAGVDAAVCSGEDYLAYWFIITSAKFIDTVWADPLDYLLPKMKHPDTFAISPSVNFPKHCAWEQWMSPRDGGGTRRIWGIDYICALISAEKYHALGGFRPELKYMWGLIGEMNWKARKNGWKLYINDNYTIEKHTDIGYEMNCMNMSAGDRRKLASANSKDILSPLYGEKYPNKFRYEYTELKMNGDY